MSDQCQVIVFASQKGGSGKTTLAGHVAVQAELAGAGPVAIIDTDPQGSLAKWWNAREAKAPSFAQATLPTLARDIETLRNNGARLIVIDTPPAVTSSIVEVVTHADLVVIPTRPSPHDLRAVGATVDIAEHQNKPLVFVVNSATMRARITTDIAVALSQHGTVAPSVIHHRVDFAASMIDGRTVMEVDAQSRSAKEITKLWTYLDERLAKQRANPIAAQMAPNPFRQPEPVVPQVVEEAHYREEARFVDDEIAYEIDDLLVEDEPEPVAAVAVNGNQAPASDPYAWRDPGLPSGHVDMRLGLAVFGRRPVQRDKQTEQQDT